MRGLWSEVYYCGEENLIITRNDVLESTMLKRIDDSILAYTAGLFDGEGCISTTSNKYTKLILDIASTNVQVIHFLVDNFGGTGYDKKYLYRKEYYRQIWRWRLNGIHSQEFLKQIYPFLIIKKRQVELALAFPTSGGKESEPIRKVFRKILSELKNEDVILIGDDDEDN